MSDILKLSKVSKSFGPAQIIKNLDLNIKKGERHAIIGPNGAGKSTLFHLISGHYTPTSGSICLLYTSPSPRDLSTSRMPSSA